MSGAILPTRLADLARGDLAWLRAFLSGQGTDGTSRIAQLDARHDTERQDTLLTWAACHGQAEAVRLLLEVGASVGATTGGGASALHIACQQGHVQCARLLLEASAAVNQAAGGGFSPLRIASQLGHLEIAQLLRDAGADINQATQDGGTPLLIACAKGHLEIARLLLEAGAAVNQATNIGVTPLFMACQKDHLKIARLLLEAGALVNQARDDGTTPLYMACQKDHLAIVRLLLEAGAAPDQAADDGATPLFVACYNGHLEVAKLLSSYGASRAATPLGTPDEVASREGHADLAAWLVASRGWTPLQHLEALTVDRARALLRGGADSSAGEPSALERARVLCSWGESDPTVAAVGSTVAIHSLVSRPSMNGKVGVVVSASASTGRFGVRVAGEAKAFALRPANLQPAAEAVEVGGLILKATEWSPQSHELFPEAARKRAVEVMRLGYLIAWDEERFDSREGAAPELADIWRGFVLPRVVVR